ncbi:hypothetical protein P3S68_024022 [Capsicum galapagoense]
MLSSSEILSFEVTWLWLLAPPCGLTTSTWLRCPFAPGLAIFFFLLHQDENCSGTSLRAYFFPASHSDHEYLCTELPNYLKNIHDLSHKVNLNQMTVAWVSQICSYTQFVWRLEER